MNRKIVDLANCKSAIQAIHKGLIHCGFELEFQADEDGDRELDYDSLDEAVDEAFDEEDAIGAIQDSDIESLVRGIVSHTGCGLYEVSDYLNPHMPLRREVASEVEAAIDSENESNRERLINSGEYYLSSDFKFSDLPRDVRQLMELGSDGSVSGGELRTNGALNPSQFMKCVKAVFEHDFNVDTGCSFHIHLSVPGVSHSFGAKFQAELQAYFLDNFNRLPRTVRDRLTSSNIRYCKFQASTDKFSAVHAHSLNTWEFRLFGNLNSETDARRCLLLAIESLIHGYRVKLGLSKSLLKKSESKDIEKLSREILGSTDWLNVLAQKDLKTVIRENASQGN